MDYSSYRVLDVTNYIDKYGKKLIKKLLDTLIIRGSFDNDVLRQLLIENNVIKRSTKIISSEARRPDQQRYHNYYKIRIANGRNQTIINIFFRENELPEVLKLLED